MRHYSWILAGCLAFSGMACADTTPAFNMGTVNMQKCVEKSLVGQKYDKDIRDLETKLKASLDEKQTALKDIADKLKNEDYLDSISPEAEQELQAKGQNMQMELQQLNQQAMQMMQQARGMAMQELSRQIGAASQDVAKERAFSLVISEEACLFTSTTNDVTDAVVAKMNATFEKEQQAAAPQEKAS